MARVGNFDENKIGQLDGMEGSGGMVRTRLEESKASRVRDRS